MDFLADKTGSVKKRKTQNKAKAADLEGCNRIEANEKHLLGVFFPPLTLFLFCDCFLHNSCLTCSHAFSLIEALLCVSWCFYFPLKKKKKDYCSFYLLVQKKKKKDFSPI